MVLPFKNLLFMHDLKGERGADLKTRLLLQTKKEGERERERKRASERERGQTTNELRWIEKSIIELLYFAHKLTSAK